MGLFEKIFPKTAVNQATNNYFTTLTAYQPRFTSYSGGIYEALLCRSAIHTFANHCSKLKIDVPKNSKGLKYILGAQPNPWQTTSQFLYRLATIYETDTTAFIVPILDYEGKKITGFYPVKPQQATIKEYQGQEFFEFTFPMGKKAIIEAKHVGVLPKYQYEDDFFGAGNKPLYPTLQMIHASDQGVVEGIKNSAAIRFMAILAGTFKAKTIEETRKAFVENNLQNNNTGVMMFDEKYRDVKQIDSKPLIVDDKQLQQIKNNVYTYFGTNEDILMNKFEEGQWDAYYEGKIEPFAIQLAEVLTSMIYSVHELAFDNRIIISSNKLEYASNKTKLSIITQMFDRGMMTQNQGLEILHMPPVDGGDKYYIRKEYAEIDKLNTAQGLLIEGEGGEGNAD